MRSKNQRSELEKQLKLEEKLFNERCYICGSFLFRDNDDGTSISKKRKDKTIIKRLNKRAESLWFDNDRLNHVIKRLEEQNKSIIKQNESLRETVSILRSRGNKRPIEKSVREYKELLKGY